MTDEEYLSAVLDDKVNPNISLLKSNMPKSIYKYRRFEDKSDTNHEKPIWKQSMDGVIYFSDPEFFNRNDSNDCCLNYNKESIIKCIGLMSGKNLGNQDNDSVKHFNDILYGIRHNIRIACFTETAPNSDKMWNNKVFCGDNKGYCIEYKVCEGLFYSDAVAFMKVIYRKNIYDCTKEMLSAFLYNIDTNSRIVIANNRFNFALFKTNSYVDEAEWRIIVPNYKWCEYFDFDKSCHKKMFLPLISAIYLGASCTTLSNYDDYLMYAKGICEKNEIPLFQMKFSEDKLIKERVY